MAGDGGRLVVGLTEDQLDQLEAMADGLMIEALVQVCDYYADVLERRGAPRAQILTAAVEDVPPVPPGSLAAAGDLAGMAAGASQVIAETMLPLVAEVYLSSASRVRAGLIDAAGGGFSLPAVHSTDAEDYLRLAAPRFDEVGAGLWQTVRGELADGFAAGEGIPELAARVRASAATSARTATLVARTSVIDASNAGSIQTARRSGLDMEKEWMATPDRRTRPTHRAADGERVGLDEDFMVGGYPCDHPGDYRLPASERNLCRCTVGYVIPEPGADGPKLRGLPGDVKPRQSTGPTYSPIEDRSVIGTKLDPASAMSVADLRAAAAAQGWTIRATTKPDIIREIRAMELSYGRPVLPRLPEAAGAPISTPLSAVGRGTEVTDFQVIDGPNDEYVYTAPFGTEFDIDGVRYYVEHAPGLDGSSPEVLGPLDEMRRAHAALPASRIVNRTYRWMLGENPTDPYWQQRFSNPSHSTYASAGNGDVFLWYRTKPGRKRILLEALRHETGHNVDPRDRPGGSQTAVWQRTARNDGEHLLDVDIEEEIYPDLNLVSADGRPYPRGVTKYGTSSPSEDYAESVMLYAGREVLARGRLPDELDVRDLYFEDLFPARARILRDRLGDPAAGDQAPDIGSEPIAAREAWRQISAAEARELIAQREASEALRGDFPPTEEYARELGEGIAARMAPDGSRALLGPDGNLVIAPSGRYAPGDNLVDFTPADRAVSDLAIRRASEILDELSRSSPLPHPVTVVFKGFDSKVGRASGGGRLIELNGEWTGEELMDSGSGFVSWFMPTGQRAGMDQLTYHLAHEYGHVMSNQLGQSAASFRHLDDMSPYGRSDPREGYAEAFAEWWLSDSKTTNAAARAYADHFKWPQRSAPRSPVAATDGQSPLDVARGLGDIDYRAGHGATPAAMRSALRSEVRAGTLTQAEADRIDAAHVAGDVAAVRVELDAIARRRGVQTRDRAGEVVEFDPASMQVTGGAEIERGARVRVERQGARQRGRTVIAKTQVTPLTPDELRALQTAALVDDRRIAAVVAGLREQGAASAAQLDRLIARSGGLPAEVRAALMSAVANPAALNRTVTALLRRRGVKTSGTAGRPTPFDAERFRVAGRGETPSAGDPVKVIKPAYVRTEPDGSEVVLVPGEVERIAPKVTAAKRPKVPDEIKQAQTRFTAQAREATKGRAALKAAPLRLSQPGTKYELAGSEMLGAAAVRTQAALVQYVRGAFRPINSILRFGRLPDSMPDWWTEPELRGYVDLIRRAFDVSRLRSSVVLYRGVGTGRGTFGDPATWPDDLAGREFVDEGVFSASTSRAVADEFGEVQLRIVVPEGHRAITLSSSGADLEAEVALAPGTRFRVVKDRGKDASGKRRLDVEVVPDDAPPLTEIPTPTVRASEVVPDESPMRAEIRELIEAGGSERGFAGISEDVKEITNADGRRVIRKRFKGDTPERDADAEELGSLVGEAIGLRAPVVVRLGDREVGIEFIDGEVGDTIVPYGQATPDDIIDSDDGRLIGLLDAITRHSDRNPGNWVRTPAGRLAAIDQGAAFQPSATFGGNSEFGRRFVEPDGGWLPNDMSREDLAIIRRRLEALKPEFVARRRTGWWSAMMTNLRQVERRATGTKRRVPDAEATPVSPPTLATTRAQFGYLRGNRRKEVEGILADADSAGDAGVEFGFGHFENLQALESSGMIRKVSDATFSEKIINGRVQLQGSTRWYITDKGRAELAALRAGRAQSRAARAIDEPEATPAVVTPEVESDKLGASLIYTLDDLTDGELADFARPFFAADGRALLPGTPRPLIESQLRAIWRESGVPDLRQRRRIASFLIDRNQGVSSVLAEVDELIAKGVAPREIMTKWLEPRTLPRVGEAAPSVADAGAIRVIEDLKRVGFGRMTAARARGALDQAARRAGMRFEHRAGDFVEMTADRAVMREVGRAVEAGQAVRVQTPGLVRLMRDRDPERVRTAEVRPLVEGEVAPATTDAGFRHDPAAAQRLAVATRLTDASRFLDPGISPESRESYVRYLRQIWTNPTSDEKAILKAIEADDRAGLRRALDRRAKAEGLTPRGAPGDVVEISSSESGTYRLGGNAEWPANTTHFRIDQSGYTYVDADGRVVNVVKPTVTPLGGAAEAAEELGRVRRLAEASVARHRSLVDLVDDLERFIESGEGSATRRVTIEMAEGIPDDVRTALLGAKLATALKVEIARQLRRAGIKKGSADGVVRFDPTKYEAVGSPPKPGEPVYVLDPGYTTVDGVVVRPPRVAMSRSEAAAPLDDVMAMTEPRARRQIEAALNGTYGRSGLRVQVGDIVTNPGSGHLTVEGVILQGTSRVGRFTREIRTDPATGQMYAHHEILKLDHGVQGSGFATEFNANLESWYRRSGLSRIELEANIDVGGYTWASQGYDFATQSQFQKFLSFAGERLKMTDPDTFTDQFLAARYPGLTAAQFRQQVQALERFVVELQNSGRRVTAYELSQFGRRPGQPRDEWWIGKILMVGSHWDGVKLL